MVAAQAAGDHTRALKLHLELMPLFKALFMTANPIMVKEALAQTGFPVGDVPPAARAADRGADRRARARHASTSALTTHSTRMHAAGSGVATPDAPHGHDKPRIDRRA